MHVLDELLGFVLGQRLHALGLVLERQGAADEGGVLLGDLAAFQAVGQRGLFQCWQVLEELAADEQGRPGVAG